MPSDREGENFGNDEHFPSWTERYADALEEAFERLRMMPELARERLEFNPHARIHPTARHIVIYRVDGDHLTIVRVLGQGQDWEATLNTLG